MNNLTIVRDLEVAILLLDLLKHVLELIN